MSSAREETSRLAELLRRERFALAEFLVALADFDRRRLWVDRGHASLFAFLVKDLGLSNGAAAYRRAAAELVQRFPQIVEPLRDGRLCLTTVFEVSRVITEENAAEVLPRFYGSSRREAKEVVAELAPEPAPERTIVTGVRAAPTQTLAFDQPSSRPADQVRANSEPSPQEGPAPSAFAPSASARTVVEPKTAELSRVHVTVSRRLLEKLEAARAALSHSRPNASDADVLEAGLDLILERAARRRGLVKNPRKRAPAAAPAGPAPEASSLGPSSELAPPEPPPSAAAPEASWPEPQSRYVTAEVRRAVWERDRGQCQWPLEGGGICGSTLRVEIDHIDGWALGCPATIDRLRLLCRFHQDVSARRLYGNALMNDYTRPKGGGCAEPVAAYAAGLFDPEVNRDERVDTGPHRRSPRPMRRGAGAPSDAAAGPEERRRGGHSKARRFARAHRTLMERTLVFEIPQAPQARCGIEFERPRPCGP